MKIQLHWLGALFASVAIFATGLPACAPASPPLMQPDKTYGLVGATGDLPEPIIPQAPKVDILFVVDDSLSMQDHVAHLKINGLEFAKALTHANGSLDFHVGVVSVWDEKTSKMLGYPSTCPQKGQLQPLRDPACPGVSFPGPQFIARDTGKTPICAAAAQRASDADEPFVAILANTIALPITPVYVMNNGEKQKLDAKHDEGPPVGGDKAFQRLCGSQFEESLSPIMPALSGLNPGFYRPEAKLAIIILTDAVGDDSVGLVGENIARDVLALKGGRKEMVSTYAALVAKGTKDCEQDPSGTRGRIETFLRLTGGNKPFDLCEGKDNQNSFGKMLAAVGADIQKKAAGATVMKIKITGLFDANHVTVLFGVAASGNTPAKQRVIVPMSVDSVNGYFYNERTGFLEIPMSALAGAPPGSKVSFVGGAYAP